MYGVASLLLVCLPFHQNPRGSFLTVLHVDNGVAYLLAVHIVATSLPLWLQNESEILRKSAFVGVKIN